MDNIDLKSDTVYCFFSYDRILLIKITTHKCHDKMIMNIVEAAEKNRIKNRKAGPTPSVVMCSLLLEY